MLAEGLWLYLGWITLFWSDSNSQYLHAMRWSKIGFPQPKQAIKGVNKCPCRFNGKYHLQKTSKKLILRDPFIAFSFSNICLSTLQLTNIYGNIYTVWMGQTPLIVLNGYRAVKDGLISHSEETSGRPLTPFYRDLMGEKGTGCYFMVRNDIET